MDWSDAEAQLDTHEGCGPLRVNMYMHKARPTKVQVYARGREGYALTIWTCLDFWNGYIDKGASVFEGEANEAMASGIAASFADHDAEVFELFRRIALRLEPVPPLWAMFEAIVMGERAAPAPEAAAQRR